MEISENVETIDLTEGDGDFFNDAIINPVLSDEFLSVLSSVNELDTNGNELSLNTLTPVLSLTNDLSSEKSSSSVGMSLDNLSNQSMAGSNDQQVTLPDIHIGQILVPTLASPASAFMDWALSIPALDISASIPPIKPILPLPDLGANIEEYLADVDYNSVDKTIDQLLTSATAYSRPIPASTPALEPTIAESGYRTPPRVEPTMQLRSATGYRTPPSSYIAQKLRYKGSQTQPPQTGDPTRQQRSSGAVGRNSSNGAVQCQSCSNAIVRARRHITNVSRSRPNSPTWVRGNIREENKTAQSNGKGKHLDNERHFLRPKVMKRGDYTEMLTGKKPKPPDRNRVETTTPDRNGDTTMTQTKSTGKIGKTVNGNVVMVAAPLKLLKKENKKKPKDNSHETLRNGNAMDEGESSKSSVAVMLVAPPSKLSKKEKNKPMGNSRMTPSRHDNTMDQGTNLVIEHDAVRQGGEVQNSKSNMANEMQLVKSKSSKNKKTKEPKTVMAKSAGEKPKYNCENCGKEFVSQYGLKYHHNSMHLLMRYKCRHCACLYCTREPMAKHVEQNHPNFKGNVEKHFFVLFLDK